MPTSARFMQFLVSLVFLLASGVVLATPVSLDIDFRDGSIWGGEGGTSFSYDGITVSSDPDRLYRDDMDGYGVLGGEYDEIDRAEVLRIFIADSFYDSGQLLTGVLLTDLFPAPDGGSNGEAGWVSLYDAEDVLIAEFFVNAKEYHPNGEYYLDFGGAYAAATIVFSAFVDSELGYTGSEFSVAGLTTTDVPEPGTMLLLGSGLLLLSGSVARRRRRR